MAKRFAARRKSVNTPPEQFQSDGESYRDRVNALEINIQKLIYSTKAEIADLEEEERKLLRSNSKECTNSDNNKIEK